MRMLEVQHGGGQLLCGKQAFEQNPALYRRMFGPNEAIYANEPNAAHPRVNVVYYGHIPVRDPAQVFPLCNASRHRAG
jgi:hypothetical protein